MKKIFTLLVILFAISPMFSQYGSLFSLNNNNYDSNFEQALKSDLEKNAVFYDKKIFEFDTYEEFAKNLRKFNRKSIVIYIPKNSSIREQLEKVIYRLTLKRGLAEADISRIFSSNFSERIMLSGKIVVGMLYEIGTVPEDMGYVLGRMEGLMSDYEYSDYKAKLWSERRKNEKLGYGEYTDAEVQVILEQQRADNDANGKGRFTDKEVAEQIANNKNSELGAFCDAELEAQRKSNEAAGKGYKTDFEIEKLNKVAEVASLTSEIFSKVKDFETKNQFCYVLGCYYEGKCIEEKNNISSTATEKYNELSNLIKNGQPGYGTYNDFKLHDAWKELLIDAEKYGTEYGRFKFTIGKLEQEKLDYSTRTATYSATIEFEESTRYKNVIKLIEEGYKKAYKDDWSDLPQPINWPDNDSVSGHQAASNLIDGVAVYRSSLKENFTDDEMLFLAASASYGNDISAAGNTGVYNAFAHTRAGGKKFKYNLSSTGWFETLLYDLKLNIVDDNGNELVKPNRYLPINAFGNSSDKIEWKNKIEFEGIPQSVMEKIDSGNAHINLVAIYLEYGQYSESDDTVTGSSLKSTRNFMKNFPEIKLSLDKIEYVIQK